MFTVVNIELWLTFNLPVLAYYTLGNLHIKLVFSRNICTIVPTSVDDL